MTREERLRLALEQTKDVERKIRLMLDCNPNAPLTPKSRLLIDDTRETMRKAKSNVRYTQN